MISFRQNRRQGTLVHFDEVEGFKVGDIVMLRHGPWFAWRPVFARGDLVWLKTVARRTWRYDFCISGYECMSWREYVRDELMWGESREPHAPTSS